MDELRSVGLSRNKARSIQDLAEKVDAGLVEIENLAPGIEAVEPWPEDVEDVVSDDDVAASVAKVAAALHAR